MPVECLPSTFEIPTSVPNRAEGKEEEQVETSGGRAGWRQQVIEGRREHLPFRFLGHCEMTHFPLPWTHEAVQTQ